MPVDGFADNLFVQASVWHPVTAVLTALLKCEAPHSQGTTGPLDFAGPPPSDGNFCGGYAPHKNSEFVFCGGFPHAMRSLMGGWFKTRNGLTERAEPMLLKLQCYWLNL